MVSTTSAVVDCCAVLTAGGSSVLVQQLWQGSSGGVPRETRHHMMCGGRRSKQTKCITTRYLSQQRILLQRVSVPLFIVGNEMGVNEELWMFFRDNVAGAWRRAHHDRPVCQSRRALARKGWGKVGLVVHGGTGTHDHNHCSRGVKNRTDHAISAQVLTLIYRVPGIPIRI